jgi:hypothetical protein
MKHAPIARLMPYACQAFLARWGFDFRIMARIKSPSALPLFSSLFRRPHRSPGLRRLAWEPLWEPAARNPARRHESIPGAIPPLTCKAAIRRDTMGCSKTRVRELQNRWLGVRVPPALRSERPVTRTA